MGAEERLNHTNAFAAAKAISKRRELDKQRESGKRDNRYRNEYDRDNQYSSTIRRPTDSSVPTRPQQQDYRNYRDQNRNPVQNYIKSQRTYPEDTRRRTETRRVEFTSETSRPYGNTTREHHQKGYQNNPLNSQTVFKTCHYCKKPGHDINECRRREYNNNIRRNNETGNAKTSPGNDAVPTGSKKPTRPLNPIVLTTNQEAEIEMIMPQTQG
ncbi:hypothetical protein ALC62_07493 [Cyphomyrmex costatus]|uniref:Uncharacterized protein n=1 Tax=Cyphomyrmex costatus TaxID=456900 RepID=A0A151IHR6_9HYME|nr:hypothetical protein ALC62_07493 [Cyphomyrmex costatus]